MAELSNWWEANLHVIKKLTFFLDSHTIQGNFDIWNGFFSSHKSTKHTEKHTIVFEGGRLR